MRTMHKVAVLAGYAAAGSGVIAPAGAHHSTAAFDNTQVVTIEGEITQFRWINPHASIKIQGDASGDAIDGIWTVEMTAPNVLINQGWTRTALKVGDRVKMFVNPLREPIELNDGSQGSLYVGVILADGKSLGRTDGKGAGTDQ
jgi:Family of unknown function (DUF6152)